jgi:hypothetical protein
MREFAGGGALMPRVVVVVLFLVLACKLAVRGQDTTPKAAYDFLSSRVEKIRLAKSAAPPEISDKASVYVLERSGYVKVQDGTNGFSCLVDRQTPLNMEPTCFDAEGSSSTLLSRLFAEDERAKSKSEQQIKAELEEGYATGKFHAPKKPGIVYMMSDSIYLFIPGRDQLVHVPPHLMFYAPYATAKDIGSPPTGLNMPRLIREGQPDAVVIVFPEAGRASVH